MESKPLNTDNITTNAADIPATPNMAMNEMTLTRLSLRANKYLRAMWVGRFTVFYFVAFTMSPVPVLCDVMVSIQLSRNAHGYTTM